MQSKDKDADEERARWLFKFLALDLGQLRAGALLDLKDDVLRFRSPGTFVDQLADDDFALAMVEGGERASRTLLERLQAGVREGIESLSERGRWAVFAPSRNEYLRREGRVERSYRGKPQEIFLATVGDVLVKFWPQLRTCKRKECGAMFLPHHGRQVFHDVRCAGLVRYHKWHGKRKGGK